MSIASFTKLNVYDNAEFPCIQVKESVQSLFPDLSAPENKNQIYLLIDVLGDEEPHPGGEARDGVLKVLQRLSG
jgi:hypothetical protein